LHQRGHHPLALSRHVDTAVRHARVALADADRSRWVHANQSGTGRRRAHPQSRTADNVRTAATTHHTETASHTTPTRIVRTRTGSSAPIPGGNPVARPSDSTAATHASTATSTAPPSLRRRTSPAVSAVLVAVLACVAAVESL